MLLKSLKLSQYVPVYFHSFPPPLTLALALALGLSVCLYFSELVYRIFLYPGSWISWWWILVCAYVHLLPYFLWEFFKFGNIYPLILNMFLNYFVDDFCLCSFLSLEHLLFGFSTCWTGLLIFFSLLFFISFFSATFWKSSWNTSTNPTIWGFHLCYHFSF